MRIEVWSYRNTNNISNYFKIVLKHLVFYWPYLAVLQFIQTSMQNLESIVERMAELLHNNISAFFKINYKITYVS